jgi:phosphoribosylamine--glycine ligase
LNVLLIGGGGREHALAWRLKRSASCGALFTTHPSNPGIAGLARPVGFEPSLSELYRLEQFCRKASIDLVVVGPEAPLAAGVADALGSAGVAVFGPVRAAAQLEADKAYAKKLMRAASVPTAEARVFTDRDEARAYVETREDPPVVKAAGLAAGKGVFVPETIDAALAALDTIFVEQAFGDAGRTVLVEERLSGVEASAFALVDGRSVLMLDACQDHKRLGEGDTGPNTGGMGAICPTPRVSGELLTAVERDVIVPVVDALRRDDIEYRGVLYAGLMLTPAGPKVLEFNVRFGDPEAQCLVRRIGGDFAALLHATATGGLDRLGDGVVTSIPGHVCCVVLASQGYPGAYEKGRPISGLEEADRVEGVTVFHAGTARADGEIVTAGGRVLNVVAHAESPALARERAYQAAALIDFEGKTLRNDIGAEEQPAARSR